MDSQNTNSLKFFENGVEFSGLNYWGNYADTEYTSSNKFTVTGGAPSVVIPNNAGSIIDRTPSGIGFYDGITGKITPQFFDDTYLVRVNFQADSSTVNNYFTFLLDIGLSDPILRNTEDFPRGSNIAHPFTSTHLIFSGSTFLSNGGELRVSSEDDINLWDISYLIKKL